MQKIFWALILITGVLVSDSGCIQSENQPEVPEPPLSLYETPEAMPDYYTLYRHNDTRENFAAYFFETAKKDHIDYTEQSKRLAEHQRYLEYLEKTPEGSFAEYLPLRYPVSYETYLRDQPLVTFAEYLLRQNRDYAYQVLGLRDENMLSIRPLPEGNRSSYPDAHPLSMEELREIPVLYEILLCNLGNLADNGAGVHVRVFEPEIEKLQPYYWYYGQPFIWNGSYYYTGFSVV